MTAELVAGLLVLALMGGLCLLANHRMRRDARARLDGAATVDLTKLNHKNLIVMHHGLLDAARALGRRATREDWWLIREVMAERRRRFEGRERS